MATFAAQLLYDQIFPPNRPSRSQVRDGLTYAESLEGNDDQLALESYQQLLKGFSASDYPVLYARGRSGEGRCWFRIARRRGGTKNLALALSSYDEAARALGRRQDGFEYARLLLDRAEAHHLHAEFADPESHFSLALSDYDSALSHDYAASNPSFRSRILRDRGRAHVGLSRLGDSEEHLKRAVQDYADSLAILESQDSTPEVMAERYYLVGEAYTGLAGVRDQQANLERAIDSLEIALSAMSLEADPVAYAATQHALGVAYAKFAELRDPEQYSRMALQAFEEARTIRTRERYPLDHASTLMGMASAHHTLSYTQDKVANLHRALEYLDGALRSFDLEQHPVKWAATQRSRAEAYIALAEIQKPQENAEEGIRLLEGSLDVFDERDEPRLYAEIQVALGVAYTFLADHREDTAAENLQKAIECYTRSLAHQTLSMHPRGFARAQFDLGEAYRRLARIQDPAENWKRAIIAYEHAELVYLGEADSVHRALALNGRGLVYLDLAATERSQEKLLLGQAVLRSALEVFDSNTHRQEHAMVQNNLGEAHLVALDLGIGDREDHLARAEDCFKAALEVYTPDEFPDYNGLVAQNLDRLLELRDAMIRDDDPLNDPSVEIAHPGKDVL